MAAVRESVVGVFEFAWQRLNSRLEGLSDVEYFWEPVADCWSIRRNPSGSWSLDGEGESVDPSPVTTISWRTCHLGGHVLGGFGNWLRDGGSPHEGDAEIPVTAADAIAYLGRNFTKWHQGMESFPEDRQWDPIGPDFGPFADASAVDLMLHVLDEFVHHAAEISLLRDLYARQGTQGA
jgi:hypothetical protein